MKLRSLFSKDKKSKKKILPTEEELRKKWLMMTMKILMTNEKQNVSIINI